VAEGVRLYVGTHEGMFVYRSTNAGWEPVNQALISGIVDTMVGSIRRPERVYAGVAHDGIYRTDDGGLHWNKILAGDVRAVALDASEDTVYAGFEPVGLFRSEDGGDTWEEISSIFALPEAVQKRWWSPRTGIGHIRHIFVHPDDDRVLYLGMEHGGVHRSLDRGASWEDVTTGIDYVDMHMVAALPNSSTRYYCSSAQGFFASDDPNDGWTRAENGFTRNYFHDFVFLPPKAEGALPTMLIGTADESPKAWRRPERARAAIFRSDDGAESWRRVGVGAGLAEEITDMISTLVTHPLNPDAVFTGLGEVSRGHAHGEAGPGRVLLSHDRGESWADLKLEIPADRVLWAAAE